jgi:tRNA (cytidine/uridine-2'-O-)-methyltransferase
VRSKENHEKLKDQAIKHLQSKLRSRESQSQSGLEIRKAATPCLPLTELGVSQKESSQQRNTIPLEESDSRHSRTLLSAAPVSKDLLQKSQRPVQLSTSEGFRTNKKTYDELKQHFPELVLFSPQIPPNTGSVARMCAAFAVRLHLVEPLGFSLSEKALRRAGLDYWEEVDTLVHGSLEALWDLMPDRRWVFVETGGEQSPSEFEFETNDLIVLGSETTGLPEDWIQKVTEHGRGVTLTIPMYSQKVRSINLSCATAMVLFQATEQLRKRSMQTQKTM